MNPAGRPGRTSPSGSPEVELLDRAVAHARGSLALVTPRSMTAPTPCAGWDLRALLAHLDDSLASLHEAGSAQQVRLSSVSSTAGWPVEILRARACQLLADWTMAEHARRPDVLVEDRPVASSVVAGAGALEIAVHSWDVSVACGSARPLPEDLAGCLLRLAPVLVSRADRARRFAAPLPVPATATSGQRLLAFLGRRS